MDRKKHIKLSEGIFIVSYDTKGNLAKSPLSEGDILDITKNTEVFKTINDYVSIIGSIDLYVEEGIDVPFSFTPYKNISIEYYLLYHPILKNNDNLKVPKYIINDIWNNHLKEIENGIYDKYKNIGIIEKAIKIHPDFDIID